jgi:hypothetical protein
MLIGRGHQLSNTESQQCYYAVMAVVERNGGGVRGGLVGCSGKFNVF